MNKDTQQIFEGYTSRLSTGVAKSSAGLPVAKKPLLINDEEEETLPTKSKKLVKKVQNFKQLVSSVKKEIRDTIFDKIEDAIVRVENNDPHRVDHEPGEGPDPRIGFDDLTDKLFINVEPAPLDEDQVNALNPNHPDYDLLQQFLKNKSIDPIPSDYERQKGGLLDLTESFVDDLSFKIAKLIINKFAREEIKNYYSDVAKGKRPKPSNMLFLPGNDPWVVKNSDPNYPDQIYYNPTFNSQTQYRFRSDDDPYVLNLDQAIDYVLKEALGGRDGINHDLIHIMDVILSGVRPVADIMNRLMANPNLEKIRDVFSEYDKWFAEKKKKYVQQGKEEGIDYNTIKQYNDGFRWLQLLTIKACEIEGAAMNHCVGMHDPSNLKNLIFSLVDKSGYPHVTIALDATNEKESKTVQIKGNSNQKPKEEYQPYIADFLKNNKEFTNIKPPRLKDTPIILDGDSNNVDDVELRHKHFEDFYNQEDEDEGFTPEQVGKIKPKKLPKKVANYPLLKQSFKIFIKDSLEDIISERDYIDQADEGDGYELAQALQGAGEEARGELEDRIKMDFFNYDPHEPAEYFDTELENLSPDGKKLINDFSDKLATKLTNQFVRTQVPYDAEIFKQYGIPDLEADKHITDVMRANLRSASFPYKYRSIEDLEDIGDKSLPPEMRKRIAKEMLRQNKVLRGLSFVHGRDPVVKNNLMRLSLPVEMAEGRADKMWSDIAEHQPDMLYHNPLRKSQQSERERLMRGDQFAVAPLTSKLIKSLDEGLAERGGLNHMLDVIVSGFESPKEIIERLISNPNEIFSFKKFNQIDDRYMQWLREQKAKYHTRGSEEGKDIKTLFEYDDGFKWQQMLSRDACEREGSYMGHCVGNYNPKTNIIISLRDKNDEPHVTLELQEGTLINPETGRGPIEINQIKGKNNSMPKKYKDYVIRFIKQAQHMDIEGLDIEGLPYVKNDGQALDWIKSDGTTSFAYFLPREDFAKLKQDDDPGIKFPGIGGYY